MSIKTINALTLLTPSTVDVENDSVALGDASAAVRSLLCCMMYVS
jgi:hypothetical protein